MDAVLRLTDVAVERLVSPIDLCSLANFRVLDEKDVALIANLK